MHGEGAWRKHSRYLSPFSARNHKMQQQHKKCLVRIASHYCCTRYYVLFFVRKHTIRSLQLSFTATVSLGKNKPRGSYPTRGTQDTKGPSELMPTAVNNKSAVTPREPECTTLERKHKENKICRSMSYLTAAVLRRKNLNPIHQKIILLLTNCGRTFLSYMLYSTKYIRAVLHTANGAVLTANSAL